MPDRTPMQEEEIRAEWRERIQQAKEDRARFEPTWHSNLAFAAGKFWHYWHRDQRKLVFPEELQGKELYAADKITERRNRALGELAADDDRQQLLLVHEGEWAEDFQEQLNRAVGYGWDYEWNADEALSAVDEITVDMGTGAIRCRFDPTVGPNREEQVPFLNGKPILNLDEARELFANGPREDVELRDMREGRTRWQPGSPFNLLTPPGVIREDDFPWEVWVAPVHVDKIQEEYGVEIPEDSDIGSMMGLSTEQVGLDRGADTAAGDGKLRKHAWLYTCYERPCPKYPNGRVVHLGGGDMKLLRVDDELPYVAPDGSYRSGIVYFHWWRRTDTFWSRGMIEPMKDPQRGINRRGTQIGEIIDRGMPFVIVEEGSPTPAGKPVEFVRIKDMKSFAPPQVHGGIAPGPWMFGDLERMEKDLDDGAGISAASLGDNPANVDTYSALALLMEADQVKRAKIRSRRQRSVQRLLENSVHDMRTYWGAEKQLRLVSEEDEDRVEAEVFNGTQIPTFFIVRAAKGAAKPRSQAAELKKVEDVWRAATEAGVTVRDPRWIIWYKESLDAAQLLELPDLPSDEQADKAELENHLLLQGAPVPVAYYDPPPIHIPVHRQAQDQALMSGDMEAWQRIEQHVQDHIAAAAANAEQVAAAGQPQLPAAA